MYLWKSIGYTQNRNRGDTQNRKSNTWSKVSASLPWLADHLYVTELFTKIIEPQHNKTNKITCAPSDDSDQPVYPLCVIRDFTVHLKKHWVFGYP